MSYEITDYEIDYVKGYESKAVLVIDGVWKDCYMDFTVEWEDQHQPLVVIQSTWLNDLDKMITLPDELQYEIEERIAELGNTLEWEADRQASLADYYYDMVKLSFYLNHSTM